MSPRGDISDHHGLPTPLDAVHRQSLECDRCGKVVQRWRDRTLSDILKRMRHDGCGGLAGKVELMTGIEGASSRPVRRIVLGPREKRTHWPRAHD